MRRYIRDCIFFPSICIEGVRGDVVGFSIIVIKECLTTDVWTIWEMKMSAHLMEKGLDAYLDTAGSPLVNLEMQHDGRSAQTWMKRV